MDNDKYLWLLNHRLKENDDWYQQAGSFLECLTALSGHYICCTIILME